MIALDRRVVAPSASSSCARTSSRDRRWSRCNSLLERGTRAGPISRRSKVSARTARAPRRLPAGRHMSPPWRPPRGAPKTGRADPCVGSIALSRSALVNVRPANGAAQRIADDNRRPAQGRRRQIEGFGEVESGKVCREQNLGPDRAQHVGSPTLSGDTGHAVTNQIADQGLGRPGEKICRDVRPGGDQSSGGGMKVRAFALARLAAIAPGTKPVPSSAADARDRLRPRHRSRASRPHSAPASLCLSSSVRAAWPCSASRWAPRASIHRLPGFFRSSSR